MSNDTTSSPDVDWKPIVDENSTAAAGSQSEPGAAPELPEMPAVIGRLAIVGRPSKVILELPQPYKGVDKAALWHNVTIFGPCDKPLTNTCRPHSLKARPMTARRIEVELEDGDGSTFSGPGWTDDGYGGQLKTAWVPYGVPVVEVRVDTSRDFKVGGCDPTEYAVDPYPGG